MSHRGDRGEAQRKPGRSGGGGHHRGYSGAGRGGGAPPPSPAGTPALSSNRSFRKTGNGQGQQQVLQQKVTPSPSVEPVARPVHNGTHQTAPLHGGTDGPVPKPVDQRSAKPLPKPPTSHVVGVAEQAAPKAPSKGDAASAFPLQFGTIGNIMKMQIPARTNSAPPNLDEQKLDQVRHESFRAVPTQPIPTAQPQQQSQARKDLGVNSTRSGGPHPQTQTNRDVHVSNPSAPPATTMMPPVHPLGAMHMSFQHPPVPLQFGGPNPQMQPQVVPTSSLQMSMGLSVGGGPQAPQQMFMPNIHPHLQSQAMMHPGQSMGFSPQIGHQLPPQLSNMGAGPQFPQQQPGKFGGPGPGPRKSSVKITHPDTHEELRLDKTSGQRQPPNATPQAQPVPSFPPSHQINYFPAMQPGSFDPRLYFPPHSSNQSTGSQAPRYNYVSQGGQPISFMNQSINPMPSSKSGPPLPIHSGSEAIKLEGLPASAPSAPVQVTMKPPAGLYAEKVGRSSVTITAPINKAEPSVTITMPISKPEPTMTTGVPISKASPPVTISPPVGKVDPSVTNKVHITKPETPNLLKPTGSTTVSHFPRDRQTGLDSTVMQTMPASESLEKSSSSAVDKNSSTVPPALMGQRAQPALSASAPVTPIGDSGSVTGGTDVRRKDPVRRSESFKEQQKKPGKKDIRHAQQHYHIDVSDPNSVKLSSSDIIKTNSVADVVSEDISESSKNSRAPLMAELSTSTVTSPLVIVEQVTSLEAGTSGCSEDQTISMSLSTSDAMLEKESKGENHSGVSHTCEIATDDASNKQTCPSETSASSCPDVSGAISRSSEYSLSLNGSLSKDIGKKQEILAVEDHGKAEAFNDTTFEKEEEHAVGISERTLSSELDDEEKQQSVSSNDRVEFSLEVHGTTDASDNCATVASVDSEMVSTTCPVSSVVEESVPSPSDTLDDKSVAISSQTGLVPAESPLGPDAVPGLLSSEVTQTSDHKLTELSNEDPVSAVLAVQKDKPLGSTRSKNAGGKKKKRKEFLSKADAAGASDLYNAYKGPEKTQNSVSSLECADGSLAIDGKHLPSDVSDKDGVSNDVDSVDKSELDDWEDAADTPKLETLEAGPRPGGDAKDATSKKYSRDFLLTFLEHCTALPMGFDIGTDIQEALMSGPQGMSPREMYPSPGRVTERQSGGRRGDDRWNKPTGSFGPGTDAGHGTRPGQGANHGVPRARVPPNQYGGGILPLQPPGSQGVIPHNVDAERWIRAPGIQRGLIPSPNAPYVVMHKAEKKYEVGKVSDEEEAKQRQLKGILNKLTPQNFDKLFEQVKEVNIDNADTLTGVISQIFDKALMEPTFCEMYANFCFHLAGALPDFNVGDDLITFRRMLLNKCQEEFEKGEKEQAEAEKAEEEGEIKQSEQEREEKRLRARRRMLGNIRLIGELFKKRMLTERIMHECIKKLIGDYQNPDEENIESLCKLMATIGEMIDSNQKAKVHMDMYFDMMLRLSTNPKISSRVRFMLRDSIDLRKNKWQQRRKVEGPKKIEEVHRDAAQERHAQSSRLARGPVSNSSARRGPSMDYGGSRGSAILSSPGPQQSGSIRSLPSPNRGYGQDVRYEERHQPGSRTLSVPQRHTDESITLGPQGGLARGMSVRGQHVLSNVPTAEIPPSTIDPRRVPSGPNGHSVISDRALQNSREEANQRYVPDRFPNKTTTTTAGRVHGSISGRPLTPETKTVSEETLRAKSISAIREFYSCKDENEIALCIKELNSPSFYPSMVSLWVMDSFERKDLERDLLARLLVNLCKSNDSLLGQSQLIVGFKTVLSSLEDAVNDAPKAGEFLGRIFAKSVIENVCSLSEIGRLIHEGGEEPGSLLESGLASEVLGSILESIKTEMGDSVLTDIRTSSDLRLEDFRPPHGIKSKKLDAFL